MDNLIEQITELEILKNDVRLTPEDKVMVDIQIDELNIKLCDVVSNWKQF